MADDIIDLISSSSEEEEEATIHARPSSLARKIAIPRKQLPTKTRAEPSVAQKIAMTSKQLPTKTRAESSVAQKIAMPRKQLPTKTPAEPSVAQKIAMPRNQLPTKTPATNPPHRPLPAATAVATPPVGKNAIAPENITQGRRKRQKTNRFMDEFGGSGNSSDSTTTDINEKIAYKPRSYSSNSADIIGKELVRQWIDLKGKCRILYGKVIQVEPREDGHVEKVDVEYSYASRRSLESCLPGWPLKECERMDKALAWGCVQDFNNKRHDKVSESIPESEHVWQWIVPDNVEQIHEYPPKESLWFGDFEIRLEARPSEIPGAGLGVFLHATPLREKGPKALVLQAGVSFDLGVYSPLRKDDIRSKSEGLVKSFLFDGEMDSWAFGAHDATHSAPNDHSDVVYDITDNTTGQLHEIAKKRTLTYVNETDGKQKTTIFAHRDPFNHMHYLLGHEHESISIPCNEWIEVKIDYGPNYEPVRKCRGYSRTQSNTKESIQASRDEEKRTTLDDIEQNWESTDIESAYGFLMPLNWNALGDLPNHRALLLLLACSLRMARMQRLQASREIARLQDQVWTLIMHILSTRATEDVNNSFQGDDRKLMIQFLKFHNRDKIPQPSDPLLWLLRQLSKYDFFADTE